MRILSFNVTHDSSVCVLNDGKLEFFCKEERITRVKRDKDPFASLDLYLLKNKNLIDHFVYCSPSNHQVEVRGFYQKLLQKKTRLNSFIEYSHHLSHAMLAFVNSGFDESLVVVIDRDGSVVLLHNEPVARESESVYLFSHKNGFKEVHKSYWLMKDTLRRHEVYNHVQSIHPNSRVAVNNPYSIVKVYEAATTLLNLDPMENGKTMGLASYGEKKDYPPLFVDGVPISHKFTIFPSESVCFINEDHMINGDINSTNYQYYANKAYQVQTQTQQTALDLIKKYVELTNVKNVCVVGGYALNVVANNFYIKNLPDVSFYFEPTADDTGIPIGAAMIKHFEETKTFADKISTNFYHYYDESEILNIGESSNINDVVSLLVDGKSVAIFDGAPEAGPRALGHRSILFDARNPKAKEIVNRIKKREWYRPFAGVILKSEFEHYFYNLGLSESPYMTINFDATQKAKQLVPGIVHVDGTCRVQTVSGGFLYDLLRAFHKKTNCPMLLNTSFNLAGEPLVQTKADAIKTFENSELDALFFVKESKILIKSK